VFPPSAGADGALDDRGPWTDGELASLDASGPGAAAEAAAPGDAEADGAEPELDEQVEGPINRGMLLKFLSSVRN